MRGVLHQWAFLVSILAGAVLVVRSGSLSARTATLVYAVSLSSCLGISAYYHRRRWSPTAKRRMKKLDHAMIFVLVAGTYTPVATLVLPRQLAIGTLAVVWVCAAAGILLTTLWKNPPIPVEVGAYLVLGLAGLGLIPNLLMTLGAPGVILLALGGLFYVAGAIIYARRRPDPWPNTFGFHEVFHVLVVLAAGAHYAAITWMVQQS